MTAATLSSIEAAVNTALAPLGPGTVPGPFAAIRRWLGEVRLAGNGVTLDRTALGKVPIALLEWQGEKAEDAIRTVVGLTETRSRVALRVWVLARDARGPDVLVQGTATAPAATGVLALVDAVVAALNALPIAGLYRVANLSYLGATQRAADVQTFAVYELNFAAARLVPTVDGADVGSAPFAEADGDLNLLNPPEVAPAPFETFVQTIPTT